MYVALSGGPSASSFYFDDKKYTQSQIMDSIEECSSRFICQNKTSKTTDIIIVPDAVANDGPSLSSLSRAREDVDIVTLDLFMHEELSTGEMKKFIATLKSFKTPRRSSARVSAKRKSVKRSSSSSSKDSRSRR